MSLGRWGGRATRNAGSRDIAMDAKWKYKFQISNIGTGTSPKFNAQAMKASGGTSSWGMGGITAIPLGVWTTKEKAQKAVDDFLSAWRSVVVGIIPVQEAAKRQAERNHPVA